MERDKSKREYGKSFLLFVHIILGGALGFLTVIGLMSFNRNIPLGYLVSAVILLGYFFVLNKSASLFNRESVGAAYFLTISGFVVFAFIEMVNCSNSFYWNMH